MYKVQTLLMLKLALTPSFFLFRQFSRLNFPLMSLEDWPDSSVSLTLSPFSLTDQINGLSSHNILPRRLFSVCEMTSSYEASINTD